MRYRTPLYWRMRLKQGLKSYSCKFCSRQFWFRRSILKHVEDRLDCVDRGILGECRLRQGRIEESAAIMRGCTIPGASFQNKTALDYMRPPNLPSPTPIDNAERWMDIHEAINSKPSPDDATAECGGECSDGLCPNCYTLEEIGVTMNLERAQPPSNCINGRRSPFVCRDSQCEFCVKAWEKCAINDKELRKRMGWPEAANES